MHKNGFTFIEILIVTVLIILLSTIAVVSYRQAGIIIRDNRRKQDLQNLQVALESYRQANQAYPASTNCGGGGYDYSTCGTTWITDLDDNYLVEQPADPDQGAENYYGYQRTSATAYYLFALLENTSDEDANGSDYGLPANAYVVTEPK